MSVVEIGDGRAASGFVVVGGGGVAGSGRFTTVDVASVVVAGVTDAAVTLLSRDAPAQGGITYVRTQAALDSISWGPSSVGRASVVKIGDGRAASGGVVVGGGGVTVSVRLTTAAAVAVAGVAAAAVTLQFSSFHSRIKAVFFLVYFFFPAVLVRRYEYTRSMYSFVPIVTGACLVTTD